MVIVMIGMASDPVAADDLNQFELSPEQLLNATVISVSKTPEKVMDAPAAIFVLTNEDIMRSGVTSVPEALRLVPGMQVSQVNAHNWAISVRGFSSSLANKLLVLLDGREIYDPLFSGVYWDIQDLVLEDIDRIEVVRGPGASLWGANAVNGVINIITKKAQDTQGGLVSLTGGNMDRGIAEGRYGGTFSDQGYYRVYAKYIDRSEEDASRGGSAHDGQMMEHGGFRADWKNAADAKDDFTLQGDVYNDDEGDLRSVPIFTAPFAQTVEENVMAKGANILGRWNRTLSEDSHFSLQSYIDYTSRNQIVINDQRASYDLDAQYELPTWGRHKVIVGGAYRYSFDQLIASPYAGFLSDGESTNLLSSFVQDKITLDPDHWYLTLGSKFEHNDFTGFEVEPDARLQWQPDPSQAVWASVSRAVRTPSRLEHDLTIDEGVLSLGGLPAELLLQPNTEMHSEKLVAYELGYRNQITPKLMLDTTAFYNDYQALATLSFNTPNLGSIPFLFPFTTTNTTHGETYGFEATADWRAFDNWKLSGSYSTLAIQLFGPPGNVAINSEGAVSQSPAQQFNLASRWDVTNRVSFDTTLYYNSAVPGFQVPAYWLLDARLGWKITDGLQFSLVGQNILNSSTREFSSPTDVAAVNIGRAVYGNFTWRF
jgi:iron complex outermembrane receptor protein